MQYMEERQELDKIYIIVIALFLLEVITMHLKFFSLMQSERI